MCSSPSKAKPTSSDSTAHSEKASQPGAFFFLQTSDTLGRVTTRAKRFLVVVFSLTILAFGFIFGLRWRVTSIANPLLVAADSVEPAPVGIVFGAYVYENGSPCGVLEDRLLTALELYQNGKFEKFILSGDHGQHNYDEVNTMKDYLVNKGVPEEILFLDHAGFDTYDTLYRARDIFGVKKAILVTQDFHLKRALYIASSLGIDAQGVRADRRRIPEIRRYQKRELAANVKAFLDLTRARSPVFLGEEISLDESASVTHD